jgi:hypothetical protein
MSRILIVFCLLAVVLVPPVSAQPQSVSIDYRLVEVSREAPWIVMIPGAYHSWELLAPQQDIFTEEGYNTIAVTLR